MLKNIPHPNGEYSLNIGVLALIKARKESGPLLYAAVETPSPMACMHFMKSIEFRMDHFVGEQ